VTKDLASQLAGFLTELHNFPIEKAREFGVPSIPDKEVWADFYSDMKQKASTLLDRSEQRWTTEVFENFLGSEKNFQFQRVLLRRDLSREHILLDREKNGRKKISGIIDVGDPAYDFQFDCPDDFLLEVRSNYRGQIDDTFFRRLKFYDRRWPFHEILCELCSNKSEHIQQGVEKFRKLTATERANRGG
jgi:aminoglycoside 2''-phosphotransferase